MEGIWRISYNNGTNGITLSNDLFKFLKQPQTYLVVLYLIELCSWYMPGALHHSSNCLEYGITSLFKSRTQKILAQIFHPKKFPEWKISNPKILWSSLSLFEVTELKLWSSPLPPLPHSWAVKNYQFKVIILALYQKTNRFGKWPKMSMRLGDFIWATLSLILKSLSYFEYHI